MLRMKLGRSDEDVGPSPPLSEDETVVRFFFFSSAAADLGLGGGVTVLRTADDALASARRIALRTLDGASSSAAAFAAAADCLPRGVAAAFEPAADERRAKTLLLLALLLTPLLSSAFAAEVGRREEFAADVPLRCSSFDNRCGVVGGRWGAASSTPRRRCGEEDTPLLGLLASGLFGLLATFLPAAAGPSSASIAPSPSMFFFFLSFLSMASSRTFASLWSLLLSDASALRSLARRRR